MYYFCTINNTQYQPVFQNKLLEKKFQKPVSSKYRNEVKISYKMTKVMIVFTSFTPQAFLDFNLVLINNFKKCN